ncbi:hypothetical protein C8R44DRAFT_768850 [Mycena epipterygia]|nr:hypothetical protein C8R44DRAFT_768850 [Mycena epipterygia]
MPADVLNWFVDVPPAGNSLFEESEHEAESDKDVPWATRRALTRSDRALCRTLVKVHNFPPVTVHRRFGWHEKTVRKAVANKYSPEDNVKNDPENLPSNFETILKEMVAERDDGNTNDKAATRKVSHKVPTQTVRPLARVSQPGGSSNTKPMTRKKAKIHAVAAQVDRKPTLRQPKLADAAAAGAPYAPTTLDEEFLRNFVASVPLDPVWSRVLQNAGFTEEKLCRMAGIHPDKVSFCGSCWTFANLFVVHIVYAESNVTANFVILSLRVSLHIIYTKI